MRVLIATSGRAVISTEEKRVEPRAKKREDLWTIKRGVSLYSYQNDMFQGKMTLKDCIRTSAEMGTCGVRRHADAASLFVADGTAQWMIFND
jgi:predicted lipoprotein with Yx(FWY)xxD motif